MGGGLNKGIDTWSTRALHIVTVATALEEVRAPIPPFRGGYPQVYAALCRPRQAPVSGDRRLLLAPGENRDLHCRYRLETLT